eukprot:TRINITY_DN38344_c0_g1_i1.p1 TRINITY_DN38344_c0_g1~~TRINITY_DN38344_c0_g1_i1.p1  ORF type:complete len:377 (-),score=51.01 TRINITY_DN38344_c0_g1_i1:214-1344(-)
MPQTNEEELVALQDMSSKLQAGQDRIERTRPTYRDTLAERDQEYFFRSCRRLPGLLNRCILVVWLGPTLISVAALLLMASQHSMFKVSCERGTPVVYIAALAFLAIYCCILQKQTLDILWTSRFDAMSFQKVASKLGFLDQPFMLLGMSAYAVLDTGKDFLFVLQAYACEDEIHKEWEDMWQTSLHARLGSYLPFWFFALAFLLMFVFIGQGVRGAYDLHTFYQGMNKGSPNLIQFADATEGAQMLAVSKIAVNTQEIEYRWANETGELNEDVVLKRVAEQEMRQVKATAFLVLGENLLQALLQAVFVCMTVAHKSFYAKLQVVLGICLGLGLAFLKVLALCKLTQPAPLFHGRILSAAIVAMIIGISMIVVRVLE